MANLLNLPLDIHINIVQYLDLNDCLCYAQLSTQTHDAVYYVFAHRTELNFSSVLSSYNPPKMSLSPEMFLNVLHAHTRAMQITNFCIPQNFSQFHELSEYLKLYWKLSFVPCFDESLLCSEASFVCGTYVGHPTGQLQSIAYLGNHGASSQQESQMLCDLFYDYDDMYGTKLLLWVQLYHHHLNRIGVQLT